MNGNEVAELEEYISYFSYWLRKLNPKGNNIHVINKGLVGHIYDQYSEALDLQVGIWKKIYPKKRIKILNFSKKFDYVFKLESANIAPKFTVVRLTALSCYAFGVRLNEKAVFDIIRDKKRYRCSN